MKIKRFIRQRNAPETVTLKRFLISCLCIVPIIALSTVFFVILHPESDVMEFILSVVAIWITFIPLLFFKKWGILGDIIVCFLIAIIALLWIVFFSCRYDAITSEKAQQVLQEASSYDALQSHIAKDYELIVLDQQGGRCPLLRFEATPLLLLSRKARFIL